MSKSLELQRNGYVVIDAYKPFQVKAIRKGFMSALEAMPEFVNTKDMLQNGRPFVMGGFSALGNPSSFHNILVRNLREWSHCIVLKKVFLEDLKTDKKLKLEQTIDRMLYRPQGKMPSKESWHRDESINAIDSDTIYGGWVNLDDSNQYFSCCPGTHKEVGNLNRGFAKIKDASKYKKMKQIIEIPPGHILIFYERIVHEVLSKPAPFPGMCRLFLGWRLTYGNQSLLGDKLKECLERMKIVPLKSGQMPPMYAKLHWVNWRDKLLDFTKDINPLFIEDKELKKTGEIYRVVQQYMDGLIDKGIVTNVCPPYMLKEYKMHIPQRKWRLLKPGSQKEYIEIDADENTIPPQMPNFVIDLTNSSDDEDEEFSPLRRKKKSTKPAATLFDDESDSSDDEKMSPLRRKKQSKKPAATLFDDESSSSSEGEHDTSSDEEDINNNNVKKSMNTSSSSQVVTMSDVIDHFKHGYAPWASKGIERHFKIIQKRAYIYFKGPNVTTIPGTRLLDKHTGYWIWYFWDVDRFVADSMSKKVENKIATEEDWDYMEDNETAFHRGRALPDMAIEGPLKMYVWEKANNYVIAGSALSNNVLFNLLPNAFMGGPRRWTGTKRMKKSVRKRAYTYSYPKNKINKSMLMTFQHYINETNEKFSNATISTEAPWKRGVTSPPLVQILGWHVKTEFPKEVVEYFKLWSEGPPENLGVNGPTRERETIHSPWRYRFGLCGVYSNITDLICSDINVTYRNFNKVYIYLHWERKGKLTDDSLVQLQHFADTDRVNVAMMGWGTYGNKRKGHARMIVKIYNEEGRKSYRIIDPWMKGTNTHRDGYEAINDYLRRYDNNSYSLKMEFHAEQLNEGSCVAIAMSRALNIAIRNKGRIVTKYPYRNSNVNETESDIAGVKEDIDPWIPVFVKQLMNRRRGTSSDMKAMSGGNLRIKF